MTLEDMKPGQKCQVKKVRGKGTAFHRLLEMGIIDDATLKVLRYAPLGDPIEIELHGYCLSLRKAEASMVEIYNA